MSETFKNVRYALVAMLLFACTAIQAQTISGNVKDSAGEPIIGATVMEQGTQNGTVTDFDGNFTLKLQKGGNLNISYVGMKSQVVKTAGKSSVNVTLEDDNTTLNDLVVVGYGTMKKSDLTGSVSSVNTDQLNAKGAADVMGNLQGATPGVNITQASGRTNGGFNIEIRGKSSINSSTTPLFVVDGVMCDDIDWLNPQDIEKIDVLKDASSTAIYGSRATAGVVMVTTKGGLSVKKSGEKATISYDGYYGWTKAVRMSDVFMSADKWYQFRFLNFLTPNTDNTSYNSAAPPYSMSPGTSNGIGQCLLLDDNSSYKMKEMLASGNTYDWPDLVTQGGSQQNHYIAIKGSTEKTSYHMGIGYNGSKGIFQNDEQKRINFKGSLDTQVNKLLSAGFSVNLARQKNKYANDKAIQRAYSLPPYAIPNFTSQESVDYYNQYEGTQYRVGDLIPKPANSASLGSHSTGNQVGDTWNPLLTMQNSSKQRETWRALGNLYLKFDFMKGLNFKTTFSPNYQYYREGYYEGYEDPGYPGHTKGVTDKSPYVAFPMDGSRGDWSSAYYNTVRTFEWTWDNVINWNKTFKDIHSVNLMGLFSMQKSNTEKVFWHGKNTALVGADWWAMQNLTQTTTGDDMSYTSYSENSMKSVAFRANYGYKDRYLLTATIRWDGSSKFADGNRWGSFPSFAAAWRITEEDFMKKYEWLSNLKLRVSYGVTGNNKGVGDYATQSTVEKYGIYPISGAYSTAYIATDPRDKDLKWEKSHEWNIGLDFGFLNNRINGSIDWYSKTSKDLLYQVTLPLEAGGARMWTNIGSVRNTGLEIALNATPIQTKDWNWNVGINWSTNKNKVLEISGTGDSYIPESASKAITDALFVGESVNCLYSYDIQGIVSDKMMTLTDRQKELYGEGAPDQMREYDYYYKVYGLKEGQPILADVNQDGNITDEDKVKFRGDPKWTGTFTSNLSYKNWDFSFSIYAKIGQYSYCPMFADADYAKYERSKQQMNWDYYIPAGTLINCDGVNADGTYINPVYQETTQYGEYPFPVNQADIGKYKTDWMLAKGIQKTSFAKVKNITLGYTFPKKWLTPWGCSHLRLYFTVTNPIVWTGFKGFDPEWASATPENNGPSTVTYQVGASIKF